MKTIPINVDRNVTFRDYDRSHGMAALLITSVFYTFQGEGQYQGQPALFVRLAGCNIGAKQDCQWCDTKFDIASGYTWGYEDMLKAIDKVYRKCRLIVVTGGEPLLQWRTLVPMMRDLNAVRPGLVWQFETNGLLLRADMVDDWLHNNVFIVCSPKITHGHRDYRALPQWLFVEHASRTGLALKYVVTADDESPYHHIPDDAFRAQRAGVPVFISGMAVYKRAPNLGEVPSLWDATMVDQQATAANYAHAAKLALEHGLRVSYQTHLFGAVE